MQLDEIEATKAEEEAEDAAEEARSGTSKKEQRELALSMMSKKKKRLHDRITYGQNKKNAHISSLEERRKTIEDQPGTMPKAAPAFASSALRRATKATAAAKETETPPKKRKRKNKKKK